MFSSLRKKLSSPQAAPPGRPPDESQRLWPLSRPQGYSTPFSRGLEAAGVRKGELEALRRREGDGREGDGREGAAAADASPSPLLLFPPPPSPPSPPLIPSSPTHGDPAPPTAFGNQSNNTTIINHRPAAAWRALLRAATTTTTAALKKPASSSSSSSSPLPPLPAAAVLLEQLLLLLSAPPSAATAPSSSSPPLPALLAPLSPFLAALAEEAARVASLSRDAGHELLERARAIGRRCCALEKRATGGGAGDAADNNAAALVSSLERELDALAADLALLESWRAEQAEGLASCARAYDDEAAAEDAGGARPAASHELAIATHAAVAAALRSSGDSSSGSLSPTNTLPPQLLAALEFDCAAPRDAHGAAAHALLSAAAAAVAAVAAAGNNNSSSSSSSFSPPAQAVQDGVLWAIGVCHARLRAFKQGRQEGVALPAPSPPADADHPPLSSSSSSSSSSPSVQAFSRTTAKFWVAPQDVPSVLAACARHLQPAVHGGADPLSAEAAAAFLGEGGGDGNHGATAPGCWSLSGLVSSVYFDGGEGALPVYHSRLRRDDGATLVRARWYGASALAAALFDGGSGGADNASSSSSPPSSLLFVERKTHREAWTGQPSVKERAAVPAGPAAAALLLSAAGGGSAADRAAAAAAAATSSSSSSSSSERPVALLTEVAEFLASYGGQKPLLRTEYVRSAFESPRTGASGAAGSGGSCRSSKAAAARTGGGDDGDGGVFVRVSLDQHMLLRRERAPLVASDASLPDCMPFPYAVLEVKLTTPAHAAGRRGRSGGGGIGDGGGGDDDDDDNTPAANTADASSSMPAWLAELLSSGVLVPAQRFSKFLHGAACLFPAEATGGVGGAAATTTDLPSWFFPPSSQSGGPSGPVPATIEQLAASAPDGGAAAAWAAAARSSRESGGSKALPAAAVLPPLGASAATTTTTDPPSLSVLPLLPSLVVAVPAAAALDAPTSSSSTRARAWAPGRSLAAAAAKALAAGRGGGGRAVGAGGNVGSDGSGGSGKEDAAVLIAVGPCSSPLPTEPAAGKGTAQAPSPSPPPRRNSNNDSRRRRFARRLLRALGGGGSRAGRELPLSLPVRVEPKAFFANERTFLQWMSVGVLVMMTGLGLLTTTGNGVAPVFSSGGGGGGAAAVAAGVPTTMTAAAPAHISSGCRPDDGACRAARLAGAVTAPASAAIMLFALVQYRARAAALRKREASGWYDGAAAPTLLALMLAAVTAVSVAFALVGAVGGGGGW